MYRIITIITFIGAVIISFWWFPASQSLDDMPSKKAVDNLKVGLLLPFSSGGGEYAQEILEGIQHALSPVLWQNSPALTAVAGFGRQKEYYNKVELIIRDHQGDHQRAKQLAEQLYTEDRVSILIGGLSSLESQAYSDIAQKHQRLFISLLPRWIEGFATQPYSISFTASYGWQAKVIADYLINEKHLTSKDIIAIIDDEHSTENLAILQAFASTLQPQTHQDIPPLQVISLRSPQTILHYPFSTPSSPLDQTWQDNTEKTWSDIGTTILLSKAKAVSMMLSAKDSLPLLLALERKGYRHIAMGLDHWEHPSMQQHPWSMEIGYVSAADKDFFRKDFVKLYTEQHNKSPSLLAALGYDVMMWIISLYTKAQTVRIPPLMKVISQKTLSRASISGTYVLDDGFLAREMIYIPLNQGTKRLLGTHLMAY